MQLRDFQLERYYAEHEFTTAHQISASDCESLSIGEVLEGSGTTIEELPQELPDDRPAQPSSSPFADSDQKSDAVEPADTGNETSELPHFQKQMFRTDI